MSRPRVLLALTIGGLLMPSQLAIAPVAHASAAGHSGDGPCLPGRVGNCLGTLQKSSPAISGGQNSAVPCGFRPESGYPCGYW